MEHSYTREHLKRSDWFQGFDGREMFAEELGCYASHYMLWLECIKSNQPIVILEDDFELQPHFYQSILDCLHSPFEIVRLWVGFEITFPSHSVVGANHGLMVLPTNVNREVIFKEHFYMTLRDVYGASAYYITPKAAKILVSHSLHFSEPADQFLNIVRIHKLPSIVYIPLSVRFNTHNTKSTIFTEENARLSTIDPLYKKRNKQQPLKRWISEMRRHYYYHYFLRKYASLIS